MMSDVDAHKRLLKPALVYSLPVASQPRGIRDRRPMTWVTKLEDVHRMTTTRSSPMPTAYSRVMAARRLERTGDSDLGRGAGDENESISSVSGPSAEFIQFMAR